MERWTGMPSHRLDLKGEHGGQFSAILYGRPGHLAQPRYMPYLGCEFVPTPSDHGHKVTLQWLDVAQQFITELRKLGWKRWLTLPPELTDMRPFRWAKILPTPRYTYCIPATDLGNPVAWSRRIKRSIKNAQQEGYTVERNEDLDAACYNFKSTQQRQDFDYAVSRQMLQEAMTVLGTERFRLYNAYDKNRQPACSIIVLYRAGAVVQDWLAGTAAEHLKSGVTQLVREVLFADLKQLDTAGFDFCGANIPAVAAAKAEFGATLMPFYQLEPLNLRYLLKYAIQFLQPS